MVAPPTAGAPSTTALRGPSPMYWTGSWSRSHGPILFPICWPRCPPSPSPATRHRPLLSRHWPWRRRAPWRRRRLLSRAQWPDSLMPWPVTKTTWPSIRWALWYQSKYTIVQLDAIFGTKLSIVQLDSFILRWHLLSLWKLLMKLSFALVPLATGVIFPCPWLIDAYDK